MIELTHAALVARAVRWLRGPERKHHRVYAEMRAVTQTGESPDVIGWRYGSSTVIEVKVSRADFRADSSKLHNQMPHHAMGRHRYYLVPASLIVPDEVPEHCGLLYASKRDIEVVREAPVRDAWDAVSEASFLCSAIRRTEIGSTYDSKTGRWESYQQRERRQRAAKRAAKVTT